MGTIDAVGQKIKGKAQQVKGEVEQQTGQGIKGGISKIKGKTNEAIADIKLNNGEVRRDRDK